MKELEDKIKDLIHKHTSRFCDEIEFEEGDFCVDLSKEIKDIATSFAEWINKEGYIYAGEHDYMYPDANGLIGGDYLFKEFISKRYKP